MERTTFIFSILLLSCLLLVQSAASIDQIQALGLLYKAKLQTSSTIDRSHYSAFDIAHEILSQEGLKEKDRIHRLPGQPNVEFKQYGGYITVNATAGRAFYYYFTEAQSSKKNLPLLLWLNGGPGCSSLGYGAMEELGPFRVHSDGKTLYKNKFAWNHAANVLFLESPAGVGFSYSNTSADYKNGGDKQTAADNYVFLVNWLERFPEYKSRDFYIAGESYAGHYVPELAYNILHHNKKANKTIINLRGILIGNAVINQETDSMGLIDYLATHAILSYDVSNRFKKYCLSSNNTASNACTSALDEASAMIKDIDIYNIYAPLCFDRNLTDKPKPISVMNFDPCSDSYVSGYLNRADVQEAMHANVTNLSFSWQACSDVITNWLDSPSTMIPVLKEILANGHRVWIYSGDVDGRVPVTSTIYSINVMALPVTSSWHPWYLRREVGGYTQSFEGNLTFATVRGAGHEVPSFQPARALSLVTHFLSGIPLPRSSAKE